MFFQEVRSLISYVDNSLLDIREEREYAIISYMNYHSELHTRSKK